MKTFAAAICALLVCSVYADKDEKGNLVVKVR
ncbi:hypothetical protein MTO96_029137 [Rhipicephalus appendiculatus]